VSTAWRYTCDMNEWEKTRLRRSMEQRAQIALRRTGVRDTEHPIRPTSSDSFSEKRFNAVFDDQTGQEITGFAYIGSMTTGP